MSKSLRIVYLGTPVLAVYVFEELEKLGILPDLVITGHDKPKGRRLVMTSPPVKDWAESKGITVVQPTSLKEKIGAPDVVNEGWDLFVVCAFNSILPKWLLEHPTHGVLNIHPSLLPKLRGPSPIRTAILNNEKDSVGVTIMKIDEQIDHGPIVAQASVELPEWPVMGRELDELLFREGGRLLGEVIPLWVNGDITPEQQNHNDATYTKKFTKDDGLVDLDGDPLLNYFKYCAMDGWPGTFFFVEKNNAKIRVRITDAAYQNGAFHIMSVVPEGKKEMPYDVFLGSNH